MPTERPPLVGEVDANFLRIDGVPWSAQRIPTAVNHGFLDRNFTLPYSPNINWECCQGPVVDVVKQQ
jgi:hypothetical protein